MNHSNEQFPEGNLPDLSTEQGQSAWIRHEATGENGLISSYIGALAGMIENAEKCMTSDDELVVKQADTARWEALRLVHHIGEVTIHRYSQFTDNGQIPDSPRIFAVSTSDIMKAVARSLSLGDTRTLEIHSQLVRVAQREQDSNR